MAIPTLNNLHSLLLDCPASLQQLGRAMMILNHPNCDLHQISDRGYQQVGYLFIKAMQGAKFPEVELNDRTLNEI